MKTGNFFETREKALRSLAAKVIAVHKTGGLKAVGAELMKFVAADVKAVDIVPLLMTIENAFVGTITVSKPNAHKAYWLDKNGAYKASPVTGTSFTPDIFVLKALLEVNFFDLKRGHVNGLSQQIDDAKNTIVGMRNTKALGLMYAGALAANTVDHTGALDIADLNAALILAEDRGLTPRYWVGRASTLSAIKSDNTAAVELNNQLQLKGVQATGFGGANFVYCPQATLKKVLLICDQKGAAETPEFPLEQDEWKEAEGRDVLQCKVRGTTRLYVADNRNYVLVNQTD